MKHPQHAQPEKTTQDFPIVGIGASAGGLDAFRKVLQHIPEDSGMAYVIVQHLSPDYDSNLTTLLAQSATIPVHEIINDINLAPNQVYVIPENNNLITIDGVLKLEKRKRHEKRNQIDVFFQSLAEVHKSYAIGVLLSGTAFDGTNGLKKIKEEGGTTIAQDPETAAFKGMPLSAIESEAVDFVCAPEEIPIQLLKIQNSYQASYGYSERESLPQSDEEVLNQILNLVSLKSGNDFRHYKQPTIRRRIARRMVSAKKETLLDYYYKLRIDKEEQDLLFNDLLIPVTYFFRDRHFFETLPKEVFPQLIANAADKKLRIWVAGCSTGEEAYSIAIALHEYLAENHQKGYKIQVFASDISEKCIAKARAASYSMQEVAQVSDERLDNYFIRREGHYHINKTIREMCVFAVHNFAKDPPFAKIDLISCRNVFIYFDAYLQTKVLSAFHYSLKNNGFLLLGRSESAAAMQVLFEPFSKHEKIYTSKPAPNRYMPEAIHPIAVPPRERSSEKKKPEHDFRKIASDLLFSNYTPAGVIINSHLDIVHFHGDTSPFLMPSPGAPSLNLLKMAREGLNFELRNAFLKFKKSHEAMVSSELSLKGMPYKAVFEIVPLHGEAHYSLVVFHKKQMHGQDNTKKRKTAEQQRIAELENELFQVREDIRRVTEEQQTAFEELQTTNEELLSSSEELQALNEQLETTTEELQSNNEELLCVNDELMDRQAQLSSLRNYSEFIVKTIREPLIIIDRNFMIRNANPAFYAHFNKTERETQGRSLFQIVNLLCDHDVFQGLLLQTLSNDTVVEDYQTEALCPDSGKRKIMINASRIADIKPAELILLAIRDVTDLVSVNEQLLDKNEQLRTHNEQLQLFSSSASHDLQEPLRKIHMFCQKVIDEEAALSKTGRHSLERVMKSITNMSDLVNDLIRFTRVNILEKDYKKTDLNLLLKKTLAELKPVLETTNAQVTASPLPYLTVLPSQIQQLFSNLILNSVNYTKKGVAPQVNITTEQPSTDEMALLGGEPETNYIKIKVSDNGIGFSKEYAERIFHPFYRLHTKDEYRGSGLGLTLSKKIAHNHSGFITAESKVGEGTVITVYLPFR